MRTTERMKEIEGHVIPVILTVIGILLGSFFFAGLEAKAATADDIFATDYTMSTEDQTEILGYINELPQQCIDQMYNYGWTILFTQMTMDEASEYDRQILLSRYPNATVKSTTHSANTTGITKYGTRTIYINKSITDSYGEGVTEQTILHESGHAMDRILYYIATGTDASQIVNTNYSDYDTSFSAIFTSESVNARAYVQSSSREYFADEFAACFMDPSGTAATFPQTYTFIMGVLTNYLGYTG